MFTNFGTSRAEIPLLSYPPQLQNDYLNIPLSDNEGSVSGESLSGINDSITAPNDPSGDASGLYARLPLTSPTSTRVLDLHAFFEHENEPITVTMRVVDLDERPSFAALSYVWGEWSSPKDVVYCSGYEIPVTRNCWAALRRLRKLGVTTIWVDAICINQKDDDDKGSQLPLMGRIYSSKGADTIYVWLGEGTRATNRAMDYLARGCLPFSLFITKKIGDSQTWGKGIPTGISMSIRLGLHLYFRVLYNRFRPHSEGIELLLSHPWIERLWTLQEALLSDKLVIVCGEKKLSFQALVYSVEYMDFFRDKALGIRFPKAFYRWRQLINLWKRFLEEEIGREGIRQSMGRDLDRHYLCVRTGWKIFKVLFFIHIGLWLCFIFALMFLVIFVDKVPQKSKYAIGVPVAIGSLGLLLAVLPFLLGKVHHKGSIYPYHENEALFLEIQRRQSMYPVDRYYATWSLLRRGDKDPGLPADLKSSQNKIYRLLSRDLLLFTGDLDLLLFTANAKLEGCPSWVIDWASAQPCWMNGFFFHGRPDGWANRFISQYRISSFTDTVWRRKGATLDSEPELEIPKKNELFVKGVIMGRISWCSGEIEKLPEYFSQADLSASIDHLLGAFSHLNQLTYSHKPDCEGRTKIFYVARFVTDREEYEGRVNSRYKWTKRMASGLEQGAAWVQSSFDYKPKPIPTAWDGFRGTVLRKPPQERLSKAMEFHQDLTKYFHDSKMMMASCEGDYVEGGVVPCDTQVDDVVALVKGMSLPMILRKQERGYEIVGPALFPILMDGKVWRGLQPEKIQEIVLI